MLRGLSWKSCLVYLDDIIIFSKTIQEHVSHLQEVFERLRNAGLKLKPEKCHFAKAELKYLGHVVSREGISPDPEKIDAVRSYPVPRNLKNLRAYLGLSRYYRKFIKSYSEIAAPLYELTKKDTPFVWNDARQTAFDKLKELLVSPPILGFPDLDKPFTLDTDCSSQSAGSVLCQEQGSVERVISYAGRKLNDAGKKYSITEKECLSLVFGVKHFDCYLRHTTFNAVVDHAALKWLFSLKQPTGRLARWIAFLQSYQMNIIYRAGHLHGNADSLSRRSYDETENVDRKNKSCTITDKAIKNLTLPQGISMNEIISHQVKDPDIKPIIDYLVHSKLPDDSRKRQSILIKQDQYFMHKGVLYHVEQCKPKLENDVTLQLVIPRLLVPTILKILHDCQFQGGHVGTSRTMAKAKSRFYWNHMYRDIANWISSCEVCTQKKRPPNPIRAHITPMPISSPFERISTDILGPLPFCKDSKNRYVLVFVDYFTKYVEMVPIKNIDAAIVANEFLKNIICRHGVPKYLHSDRGTQYLSNIVKEVCRLLDVKKTQTTSFHPQCNGQSERMMSVNLNSLSKYVDDKHDDWDKDIPFVQFVHNTTPCLDSTDFTPYFLTHGRNPTTFVDLDIDIPDNLKTGTADFIGPLIDRFTKAKDYVKHKLDERKAIMVKRTNKKINEPKFAVGETVYLYRPVVTPGKTAQFLKPWVGPFIISEKLSDIHMKLRRVSDGKLITNRVHINRLKHGTIRFDDFDTTPPEDINATEPAILADSEVPQECVDNNDNVHDQIGDRDKQSDVFEVEKVLRKRYTNGQWQYRVKWLTFDNKYNSRVTYDDLSEECKIFVDNMHKRLPTDKRSKKKN